MCRRKNQKREELICTEQILTQLGTEPQIPTPDLILQVLWKVKMVFTFNEFLSFFSSQTALHLAAEKNQHLMVSDLISLGANVNEQDGLGKTPLHLCAENGYLRVLEVNWSLMLCKDRAKKSNAFNCKIQEDFMYMKISFGLMWLK